MAKLRKEKVATSEPQKGFPVLPFLYALLVLGIGGLVGWLTYLDASDPSTEGMVTAQAVIQAPSAVKETSDSPDTHQSPKNENTEHTAPTIPMDTVAPKSDVTPKEEEHSTEKNSGEVLPPYTPPSDEKTLAKAHQDDHQKTTSKEHSKDAPEAAQIKPEVPSETVPQQEKIAPAGESTATSVSPKAPTNFKIRPAPAEEKLALAPVPDPELAKKSDFGLLPVISPTGKMPWRTYARPFVDPLNRPRIAIIMSEMGMSESATKTAIQNLPGAVTLSFNPYARELQGWIEQARAAGHEVLLQLPMEPFGYPNNDPGPHSLLTSLTDRENLKRLEWMLGRFTGYSGVTNQMGSRFTSSASDIEPILQVLKSRGLVFLDGRTSAKSVAGKVAAQLGMPVAVNNRFLDNKADRANIDARLADLERIARYTGTAIGVAYPYPVSMERLTVWAQTLNRKGFVLAPVSATANRQEIQ